MKIPDLLAQIQIPVGQTPRVNPQYAAEGGVTRAGAVIGGRVEGAGLIDAGGPARQAFAQAGQRLEQIGAREVYVQQVMRQHADKLKATELTIQGAQEMDEAVMKTIDDSELTYATRVPSFEGRAMQIRRGLMEKAPSDTVRAELGPMLDRLYQPNRHKVLEFSYKTFQSSTRAGIDDAIQNTARMAANEPDRNLALFYEEAVETLITSVGPAIFTPEQVRGKREGYRATVAKSEGEKLIQDNPAAFVERGAELFSQRLAPGTFDPMMVRAQGRVEANRKERNARQERFDAEMDKQYDTDRRALLADFENRALKGELSMGEIEVRLEMKQLTREDVTRLRGYIDNPAGIGRSDPDTYRRIGLDAAGMNPKTTEEAIDGLVDSKLLAPKDAVAFKSTIAAKRKALLDEAKADRRSFHAQAEQRVMTALTTRSPFEVLDPVSQKAKTLALDELTARSSAYKGSEDPLDVADQIIPRYQQTLVDGNRLTGDALRKTIPPQYRVLADVEAAWTAKRIQRAEYEFLKRQFLNLRQAEDDARAMQERMEEAKKKGRIK